MENKNIYASHDCIYPGLYRPEPATELLANKIRNKASSITSVEANMVKDADHILLEIALPGFNREDIFITGYENILSVVVLRPGTGRPADRNDNLQKQRVKTYHQNFLLPANADGVFGSAIYKDGYLTIYIPTGQACTYDAKTYLIIVY